MGSFNHRDPIPIEIACIFFEDTTYGDGGEENDGWNSSLKSALEDEFDESLEDADIWPGASLPAFLLEISTTPIPYLAAAIALFFAGEKVEKNVDAWLRLFDSFKKALSRRVWLSRTAAASFAIHKICDELNGLPRYIVLKRYWTSDIRFGEDHSDAGISEDRRVEYQGTINHHFWIEADGLLFEAKVCGNSISILRLNEQG